MFQSATQRVGVLNGGETHRPPYIAARRCLVLKVADELDRLEEDVLGVGELGVVPLGLVIEVLLSQLRVALNVADLLLEVAFKRIEVTDLVGHVRVDLGLEVLSAVFDGLDESLADVLDLLPYGDAVLLHRVGVFVHGLVDILQPVESAPHLAVNARQLAFQHVHVCRLAFGTDLLVAVGTWLQVVLLIAYL